MINPELKMSRANMNRKNSFSLVESEDSKERSRGMQ
jgi:hypothetical protein